MNDLKPCPFCGGGAFMHDSDLESYISVSCKKCGMSNGTYYMSKSKAIAGWNTRTPTDKRIAELEARLKIWEPTTEVGLGSTLKTDTQSRNAHYVNYGNIPQLGDQNE